MPANCALRTGEAAAPASPTARPEQRAQQLQPPDRRCRLRLGRRLAAVACRGCAAAALCRCGTAHTAAGIHCAQLTSRPRLPHYDARRALRCSCATPADLVQAAVRAAGRSTSGAVAAHCAPRCQHMCSVTASQEAVHGGRPRSTTIIGQQTQRSAHCSSRGARLSHNRPALPAAPAACTHPHSHTADSAARLPAARRRLSAPPPAAAVALCETTASDGRAVGSRPAQRALALPPDAPPLPRSSE